MTRAAADFPTALSAHARGDRVAAESGYRRILDLDPGHAEARHYLGFVLLQENRLSAAVVELRLAIAADPGHAAWHFNLGIALARHADPVGAASAFRASLALDQGGYLAWTNLGSCHERMGELDDAERCYRAATDCCDERPDAHFLLAALYLRRERFPEARRHNNLGIACEPLEGRSPTLRVQALCALGRLDEASALLAQWQHREPDHPVPRHLAFAIAGGAGPERCSREYVALTFDRFAEHFDETLERLAYRGPRLLSNWLEGLDPPAGGLAALDLGCGTGQVGEVIQARTRLLVGVDLSKAMLALAARRGGYQELHHADIESWVANESRCFDLITSIDTLIYLGRLDALFLALVERLAPGGRLVFTTEARELPGAPGYQILSSGRYAHHPDDLRRWLALAGLRVEHLEAAVIRVEAGCPVHGHLIAASRIAG